MRLMEAFGQWRSDWSAQREFLALDRAEREALARDVGVAEDRLERALARGSRAGEELPRLLHALSLDRDVILRRHCGVLRDMQAVCSECPVVRSCRRRLDLGQASETYRAYCPNAETIDALRQGTAQPVGTA